MLRRLKKSLKTNELSEFIGDKEVQNAVKSFLSLNRWSVFLFIFFTSLVMIFYVYNVISINKLAEDIRKLEKIEKRVEFRKRMFESDVIKLQSAERICPIAEEKLNMIKSNEFPLILESKDD